MCQSALLVLLLTVGHFHGIPCARVGVDSSAHISMDSESQDASSRGEDIFGRLSRDKEMKKLKINFYSHNEASVSGASLSEEYADFKKSIDGDTDIVVTCQQEAKSSLHKRGVLTESKWHHVGHGAHFGVAGDWVNAQIINVFVRLDGNVTITRDPHDWEKGRDWIAKNGWNGHNKNRWVAWIVSGKNTLIEESTVTPGDSQVLNDILHANPIRLTANTRLHETKGAGKGGATSYLSLSFGDKRVADLVFICAHAADEPAEERETGMTTIWEQAMEGKAPDSAFVLGDLNYRLLDDQLKLQHLLPTNDDPEGDSALVKHLFSASDRAKFKPADQLSGDVRSTLTKAEREGGLELKCNEPFKHYMPTYKRHTDHKHACSFLNSEACHLRQRSDIDQCSDQAPGSERALQIESMSYRELQAACKAAGLPAKAKTEVLRQSLLDRQRLEEQAKNEENCREEFIQAKQCERAALACYFEGEEEPAELEVEVTSGKELGFSTTLFTDEMTQRSYVMVWRVEIGALQANIRPGLLDHGDRNIGPGFKIKEIEIRPGLWKFQANIQPGFWITEIEISKPNSSEVHKHIKVADWKKDEVAYANSLAMIWQEIEKFAKAEGTDTKMKVRFEWTKFKWKRKTSDFGMLQLGWLDRLCWKGMHPEVIINQQTDKAASNGFASDHMATHFMVEWTKDQKYAIPL